MAKLSWRGISEINDKTEFEATENHVHILDRIKINEFNELFPIAEKLGQALLNALKYNYPEKRFVVFATIDLNDSFIIRFHQQWSGEVYYYNTADFTSSNSKVLMFDG